MNGAMISEAQDFQTAMTLKRASPMTHTSQVTGQAQCRISQHLTAAMLIV